MYELFSDNPHVQLFLLFLWWVLLLGLVFWLIRRGMRNTGLEKVYLTRYSTEEAQMHIDRTAAENNGKINGVPAPQPVPPEAYVKD